MNISLTEKQTVLVDQLTDRLGFANRSEFFRSLLRLVGHRPEALTEADEDTFAPPITKDTQKIVKDFRDSKLYSPAFLNDLENGLKNSKYFNTR